jgi:hypothetical protein
MICVNNIEMKKVPIQSADKIYGYDDIYYDRTLDWWINNTHKHIAIKQKWYVRPLRKGCYGYDSLIQSIGFLFNNMDFTKEKLHTLNISHEQVFMAQVASLVHDGWCCNYFFWKKNSPSQNKKYNYIKPSKPLNDKRRKHCAYTGYNCLSKKEKEINDIIARYIVDVLFQHFKK